MKHRMREQRLTLMAVLLMGGVACTTLPAHATPRQHSNPTSVVQQIQAYFLDHINTYRGEYDAQHGKHLGPLTIDPAATACATHHSTHAMWLQANAIKQKGASKATTSPWENGSSWFDYLRTQDMCSVPHLNFSETARVQAGGPPVSGTAALSAAYLNEAMTLWKNTGNPANANQITTSPAEMAKLVTPGATRVGIGVSTERQDYYGWGGAAGQYQKVPYVWLTIMLVQPRGAPDANPPIPVSSSWPGPVRRYIGIEESSDVLNIVYKYGTVKLGSDGCYFTNCTASQSDWKVEWQRMAFRNLVWGVLHNSLTEVKSGLLGLKYAFDREAANGSFPGSEGPFHGTAMFLAEAEPALILLKYSPMAKSFASDIATDTHKVDLAARYVYYHGRNTEHIDTGATDRYFEAALAFEAAGELTGDTKLKSWSHQYVLGGMHREHPDGLLPEWGSHDVFYQALGMADAERYLLLIPPGKTHDRLYKVLAKAVVWLSGRVSKDGTVDSSGDVRSKTPFPYSVVSALARWAAIANQPQYATMAQKVWDRYY